MFWESVPIYCYCILLILYYVISLRIIGEIRLHSITCHYGLQDGLVAVGSGCADHSYGSAACISAGQTDIARRTDTVSDSGDRSCIYRPGLVTGVLCCQQSGTLETSVLHYTFTYQHLLLNVDAGQTNGE